MIELRVADYCQDCVSFEARLKKYTYLTTDNMRFAHTYIYCKHQNVCEKLKRYLEKQMNANRCVICNDIIPEGRLVCPECEKRR